VLELNESQKNTNMTRAKQPSNLPRLDYLILKYPQFLTFFVAVLLLLHSVPRIVALVTVQIRAGVNFINVKHTPFSHERHFGSFFYVHISRKKLPKWHLYEKRAHLTLMKLTAGGPHAYIGFTQLKPYFNVHAFSNFLLVKNQVYQ
jgi:hypothetical protein